MAAPEIVDLEVASVWGRTLTDERRAALALADLAELPLRRAPQLPRCWELQHNLTPYDASYVALAEVLGVELLTADRRIASASGIRCTVETLS